MGLDLNAYSDVNWEVKMPSGETINIKQPTYKQMLQLEKMVKVLDKEMNFEILVTAVEFILNNNVEKKSFDKEYIAENFNNSMLVALFFGYFEFAGEIKTLPN